MPPMDQTRIDGCPFRNGGLKLREVLVERNIKNYQQVSVSYVDADGGLGLHLLPGYDAPGNRVVVTDADRMFTWWSDSSRVTSLSSRFRSIASTWS